VTRVAFAVVGCLLLSSATASARCSVRPMRLALRAASGASVAILTLDTKGRVVAGLGAAPSQGTDARLDTRGCLLRRPYGDDDVWIERGAGRVWTPHALLAVDDGGPLTIALAGGARLRVAPDGRVERLRADGTVEPNPFGTVVLEGYDERAACAAELLLGAWVAMSGGGDAAPEPRPADGVCR
jgi:hypothetical protein